MGNVAKNVDRKAHRATTFKEIRRSFGRTQKELAAALGLSTKAIQSYEQGWRPVPVRVMIQLLVLLSLYRRQTEDAVPCWETRKCEASLRKRCACFTVGEGQFCWFIGTRDCLPPGGVNEDDLMPCMSCPVVKRLLKGSVTPANKGEGKRS